MGEIRKILAQSSPGASNVADIYTVGPSTQSIVSSLMVCNRDVATATFRVSTAISGSADTGSQYIYYDIPIGGNDTFGATLGITLNAGDVVRAKVSTGSLSFNLFGVEIT